MHMHVCQTGHQVRAFAPNDGGPLFHLHLVGGPQFCDPVTLHNHRLIRDDLIAGHGYHIDVREGRDSVAYPVIVGVQGTSL